ncbi:MAG: hypothetical protein CM1200mP36_08010 [Gammaproteobacteria bacterium]|nr:MAG: hypothetical protein CM1200mP36_08010 [Gammaproteobacteria bacterium]
MPDGIAPEVAASKIAHETVIAPPTCEVHVRAKNMYLVPMGAMVFCATVVVNTVVAQETMMRQWQYVPTANGDGCQLGLREVRTPQPGAGEIQVRMRAASLNGRDRGRLDRSCPAGPDGPQVPLSDGAGEVTQIGDGVTRFEVGDRVIGTFFAGHWLDGDRPEGVMPYRRGGPGEGVLSEFVRVTKTVL